MLPAGRKQEKNTGTRLNLALINDSSPPFLPSSSDYSSSKPGVLDDRMGVPGGSSSNTGKIEDEIGELSSSSSNNGKFEDEMSKSGHSSSKPSDSEDEM